MKDRVVCVLVFWALMAGAARRQLCWADVALPIVDNEQLFLDDYAVERVENVSRRVNAVAKRPQPVIKPDNQGNYVRPLTAIHDAEENLFKLWYLTKMGPAKTYATGYATSKDGVTWDKPALGLKRMPGSGEDTNWVMWGTLKTGPNAEPDGPFGKFCFGCSVLKDPLEKNPARRYKAAYLTADRVTPKKSLGAAVSPDGIHWKIENELANTTMRDLGHMFLEPWDKSPTRHRYVFYGRTALTYRESVRGDWVKWSSARAVARFESPDFVQWPNGETVLAADTKDLPETQVYSMGVFPYEGVYIGLVNLYNETSGHMWVQLAVSRDTYRFVRVEPRVSFIPRGAEGSWDAGCIVADDGPVIIGDEMRFYYGGQSNRHDGRTGWRQRVKETAKEHVCSIGLGTIKRGRFLAWEAGAKEGMVLTRPVCIEGADLSINANAAGGRIQITLLDEDGGPIPGYEAAVQGVDNVAVPVPFGQENLRPLRNKAVRIQFRMRNAQLYGFRVSGGAKPAPKPSGT